MTATRLEEEPPCHWSAQDWLAATAQGVWCGQPGAAWRPLGPYDFSFSCLLRRPQAVVAGGEGGMWLAPAGQRLWQQLHDEVLTLVQDVAAGGGDPGLVAATGYGVHTARRVEHGALRWQGHGDDLPNLDARFALALLALDRGGWAVGTEDGVWLADGGFREYRRTRIRDTAARALRRAGGGLWAGTDAGELWRSAEGEDWQVVAAAPGGEPILSLAGLPDGRLLVGTGTGVAISDGAGGWEAVPGPRVFAECVAAHSAQEGVWALGATPGGLWWTRDGGRGWTQAQEVPGAVRDLDAP